jgi:hypothetical protein
MPRRAKYAGKMGAARSQPPPAWLRCFFFAARGLRWRVLLSRVQPQQRSGEDAPAGFPRRLGTYPASHVETTAHAAMLEEKRRRAPALRAGCASGTEVERSISSCADRGLRLSPPNDHSLSAFDFRLSVLGQRQAQRSRTHLMADRACRALCRRQRALPLGRLPPWSCRDTGRHAHRCQCTEAAPCWNTLRVAGEVMSGRRFDLRDLRIASASRRGWVRSPSRASRPECCQWRA